MQSTLADRNNNPGNLRDVSTGQFRKFNSPEEGYAALLNDLKAKQVGTTTTGLGPNSTLVDFAKTYAPASDNNDPAQYTANLANHMKVRPDAQLKDLNLGKWAEAVAKAEGYSPAKTYQPAQTSVSTPTPSTVGVQQAPEVTPTTQEKPEGFFKGLAKGLISPVATLAARPVQLGAELLGATPEQIDKFSKEKLGGFVAPVPQTGTDVIRDIGRGAETVALGVAPTSIAGAAGMGALAGAGAGLEKEATLGGAATGALTGAALGTAGGVISKGLTETLPKWLTKGAFGLSDEEASRMLQTKSVGTKQSLLNQSNRSLDTLGTQVRDLINTTEQGKALGKGADSVISAMEQFPEYSNNIPKFLNDIKDIIPAQIPKGLGVDRLGVMNLIDKLGAGTATVAEKNTIRTVLDNVTRKNWQNLLQRGTAPGFSKGLGMLLANNLRNEVKAAIPGSEAIFDELSKEMALQAVLTKIIKKTPQQLVGYNDIIPYLAAGGGVVPGITSLVAFRAARLPTTKFGIAKGAQLLGGLTAPVTQRAGLLPLITNQ